MEVVRVVRLPTTCGAYLEKVPCFTQDEGKLLQRGIECPLIALRLLFHFRDDTRDAG